MFTAETQMFSRKILNSKNFLCVLGASAVEISDFSSAIQN